MARWKLVLLVFAAVLFCIVSVMGYRIFRLVHYDIPESYAAWTTGNLMVEYLQTHTNQWPQKWGDLDSAVNSLHEKGMPVYLPIERLRASVKIDWQADPGRLRQSIRSNASLDPHLVTRLDGSPLKAVWGPDTEPNAKILNYLKLTLTNSRTALEPTPAAGSVLTNR